MKKIVMTLGVILAAGAAFAQGPYATFGLGYAGSTGSEMLGSTDVTVGGQTTSTSINGTLGAGIPIHLSGGFMFTEHLGVELGLTYLMGSEMTKDEMTSDALFGVQSSITKVKSSSIRVSPMLVMSTGGEGLSFYSKLGLIIPVSGQTDFTSSATIKAPSGTTTIDVEGENKGKTSMGYIAAFGATFPIKDNLSIFGELHLVNLRINQDTRTITSYKENSVEKVDDRTKSENETVYVDEVLPTDNDPAKTDEATKALGTSGNYTSLGVNVGIKMTF